MPPKRKADDEISIAEVCSCGRDHQPNSACDLAKKKSLQHRSHMSLTQQIIPSSPMATVIVGPRRQEMSVHKALLTVHSGFFRTYFKEAAARGSLGNVIEGRGTIFVSEDAVTSRDETSVSLPDIKVSQFSLFVGWLYTGIISLPLRKLSESLDDHPEGLWQLGHILQCKEFQNVCLDLLRDRTAAAYEKRACKWPSVVQANYIYTITEAGSSLREFAVDCVVKNNPFASDDENLKKQWKNLFAKQSDLSMDYIVATGNNMKAKPWLAEYRDLYVQEDVPLDERWRDQILMDHSEGQIEQKAKGREGDWLSKVEYAHLKKVQKNSGTAARRGAEQTAS